MLNTLVIFLVRIFHLHIILCNEALLVKELDDNYFHENCYDILKKLISKKICEDIWNIIIYKIQ